MPYRTNASELHDADVREEAEALRSLSADAKMRRRRAAIVLFALGIGITSVLSILHRADPPPRYRCHDVELRWENAPHIPANTWTSCQWR